MTPSRKRLRWIIGGIALLVIGAALYAYFIGTRTLLEHAENFTFRRMTAAKLPADNAYRFFYATNRSTGRDGGSINERFSSARDTSLKFGLFDTRVEPTLGLGMIIDPSKWFLNEEIQLLDVQPIDQHELVNQLQAQIAASPQRSILLVVHGFREAFPSALRKTAFLAHILDIDTPVLLFDWPGDQGSSLRGYRRARHVATESGAELATTIQLVVEQVQPDRLWLVANSMGAQVVVNAFSHLYRNTDFADTQTEIENVILTAADADHKQFNTRFRNEIEALAENTTLYVSSNDRALLASRFINRGQRLGESTLDPGNPGQVEQAMSFSELLQSEDDRLVLVDVTPVNRTRNFHNFSLETPEFFDDLFLRLTGSTLPMTRELYPVKTPEGRQYFVLTRGR